jgi:uncharacterized protein YdeI (YjbR/CyaY-like superfamily)
MASIDPEDVFSARNLEAWRRWLREHHDARTQVWLLIRKKHAAEPGIGYEEAVEEALCWGWIDGLTKAWDERDFALRFTPRKPRSVWSESNVARVGRLVAAGRMQPAGQALVSEAKRNGSWDAAASGRLEVTPPDLAAALAASPQASAAWEALAPTYRRQYLYWVLDAKRAETRTRRVADVVRRAAAGLKPGDRG